MAKIQKRTGGLSAVRARAKARAVPATPVEEKQDAAALAADLGVVEVPAQDTTATPPEETPTTAPVAATPAEEPAPEPVKTPPAKTKKTAKKKEAKKEAKKPEPTRAEARKGTSFHLSTETAALLTEYLQNNFVYTGATLTKGEAVAQAFQEHMPTVAEAQEAGQPLADLKLVMVNLPASARLAMTKAKYVTRADGVRVTRNWYYNEAVRRWLKVQ